MLENIEGVLKRMGTGQHRTYCAFNTTGESFLGLNICRADTPLATLRGMFGQFRMKSGEGVWFVPSRGIHTLALLGPMDLIYLNAKNCVIHLVEHGSPFRIAPIRFGSSSVLKLPPHTIYSSQTHVGDHVLICPQEEMEMFLKRAVPVLSSRNADGKGAGS